MTALAIIGLILGIIVMIALAYWGLHAVPLSLVAGAVVCIFNGINLWTGFTTSWVGGLATVFSAYYILFFASTCFANIMGETGACTAIAYKFLDWFGKKHIITVLTLFCFILCYGGVSFFVVMFAVGPILFKLFEELNIPRKLAPIPIGIGGAAWCMAMPGSTQVQNVIPTALGTSLMSAPLLGIAMAATGMVISLIYAERVYKKEMALVQSGESIGWDKNWKSPIKGELRAKEDLPGVFTSFLPMIVLVAFIIIGSLTNLISSATLLSCLGMSIGFLVCLIANFRYLRGKLSVMFKNLFSESAGSAATSALILGAVVGFGSIVSSTEAFQNILTWLMALDIPIYWKGVISTGVVAGVTASASSGEQLVMQYLGDYFIQSGCNLDVLHRLMAFASITLDSLPHSTGCFLMFSYFGTNHKLSYKYAFWSNTVFTLIVTVVFTTLVSIIL
ncbi:MAG: GntP family permease [Anaerovoracaceae bacterium]